MSNQKKAKMLVPVNEPLLDGKESEYLAECIRSGWISSEGPFIKDFENKMAELTHRKHAIAVSNGSIALDLALSVLGLKDGDEVILPSHTIISCATAILRAGAIPVPVDCCPDTFNMTSELVANKISKKTKAIMLVHIFGLPVDCDGILELAEKHNLIVIEDAAEVHGQFYKNRPCGSIGHISTFSFYPNKHITTGEGGMILTNDDSLATRCRYFMNLCFDNTKRFQHEDLGWNYRFTNLQAAVGVAQLEQLDRFIKIKRQMGERYTKGLASVNHIKLPIQKTDYAENIYWVYPIVLKESYPMDAAEFREHLLNDYSIMTRPFFWPIHKQPALLRMGLFQGESLPVSERIAIKGFYIPSGMALTNEQIDYVIYGINDLFDKFDS